MSRRNQIEAAIMATMTRPRKPGSTVVFIPSTPRNINVTSLIRRRNTSPHRSNSKVPSNKKTLNALANQIFRTMSYNQKLKQYAMNIRSVNRLGNNHSRGLFNNKGKRPLYTKILINIEKMKKTLK